jgi:transketolase
MTELMKQADAYGMTLHELAKKDDRVVAVDADVAIRMGTRYLMEEFPSRHIDVGIAEQNMVGVSAGLAVAGKIPFAGTIATFATGRTYDQIRQSVAYPNLNVKLIGGYSGICVGQDGPTHQACEDISLMRGLPNFTVLVPCDPLETKQATVLAHQTEGPVYVRLIRHAIKNILPADYRMELGKAAVLRGGNDVTIISCGIMVERAVSAAALLEQRGISARVLNMSTIKPFDGDSVIKAAEETAGIVTAEDHSIIGGLGSAVAEVLAEAGIGRLRRIGIPDCFGESCLFCDLFEKFGLTPENIVKNAEELIEMKNA